jgi:hypothetical protein
MDQERLISTIKAHIASGDKATGKAEQHYIAVGQYLATLKKEHTRDWAEWEELLKTKVDISTGRASELMQIADRRKTIEEVRADTNRRKIEHRKASSFRNEEDEPETNETKIKALLSGAERARRCASFDGVPNQEVIEAVRRTAEAWRELLVTLTPPAAKTGDGRCPWIEDDGGRETSGIANAARRKDRTGDCVTRAIAIATGKPYLEVHTALTAATVRHVYSDESKFGKWQRRHGGVCTYDADHGCPNGAYGPYLESLGWKFTSTKDQKVRLRADELPLGRLVVEIRRHLVAVIDGVIHDTYDSGGAGRVRVKGYWRAAT